MNNKVLFSASCIFFFGIYYLYSKSSNEVLSPPAILGSNVSPMQKTVRRIKAIQEMCGDLCDTSKEITPGEFLGSVTSAV